VRITQIDGSDEVFDSDVRTVTRPESLTYLWGSDQLRFGLVDSVDKTTLTLAQTFDDRNMAASMAAGWHLCLGALELLLNGEKVPSVVGMNAMEFGWQDLEQRYQDLFHDQTDASNPDDQTEEA
jgi:hypothetical protein